MNEIDKNYNKTFEDIKHIDENGQDKDMKKFFKIQK